LEGINYLRVKGLPAGHIHCGNIVVENNVARITDYELKLLPTLKPSMTGLMAARPGVDPDVVCFGAILFEMATGQMMDKVDMMEPYNRPLPTTVMEVLNNIFWTEEAPPSLEMLLDTPLFANARMPDLPPLARVKLGPRAKEALKECRRLAPAAGDIVKPIRRSAARQYEDTPLTTTSATGGSGGHTSVVVSKKNVKSPRPTTTTAATTTTSTTTTSTATAKPKAKPTKAKAKAPAAPKAPAPPAAPAAPAAPPAGKAPPPVKRAPAGRGGLLSSIEGFSKGGLKKAVTVDKSKPKL
jgi:hypothetical protein